MRREEVFFSPHIHLWSIALGDSALHDLGDGPNGVDRKLVERILASDGSRVSNRWNALRAIFDAANGHCHPPAILINASALIDALSYDIRSSDFTVILRAREDR